MLRYVILLLSVVLLASGSLAQDGLTSEVIRLINEARTAAGVELLYPNSVLDEAARAHSDDMALTATLSHLGSDGSQFWERAARAGYTMTNGAQNVLARGDLSAQNTVLQWQQNPANNANLLNADYDEVGFAYARSANGTYYYTLLLGTRADFTVPVMTVVPATATLSPSALPVTAINTTDLQPTRDPLILTLSAPLPASTPDFRPTRTPDPLMTPTIEMFPTATPLPEPDLRLFISGESVTLQNAARVALDLTDLRFESDTASMDALRFDNGFMTIRLSSLPAGDCLQAWISSVQEVLPRPPQCDVRHGWISVGAASVFWRETTQFRVLNDGVVVGICAVSSQPSVCNISLSATGSPLATLPQVTSQAPNTVVNRGVIRILIDASGVTVQNLTGSTVDLSQYRFEGSSVFEASAWNTPDLSRSLNAIPSGDCLQVWSNQTTSLPKPETCRYRHGWVGVGEAGRFWEEGFAVYDDGSLLGRCEAGVSVCDIRP